MVSVRQVAEWMGHANPTTTELVYTHLYAKADHDDEMAALGALAAIPMYNGDNVIPLHGSGRLPERVRTSAGNPGFLGFKPLPNFVGPSLAFCVLLVQVVLVCVDVRGDDGSSGLAAKEVHNEPVEGLSPIRLRVGPVDLVVGFRGLQEPCTEVGIEKSQFLEMKPDVICVCEGV